MRRRIPDYYTVLIARTGREPIVFSVQPVAVWIALTLLLMSIIANLYFLLFRTSTQPKQASTELQQASDSGCSLSSIQQVLS